MNTYSSVVEQVALLPLSDARELLDDKEEELAQQIMAIRALRNTLAPINKLPDEILCQVFLALRLHDIRSENSRTSLDWLVVTCICKRWHNVASGSTKLWSYIDARNQNFALECIERSEETPLHVIMDSRVTRRDDSWMVHALKPEMHRMKVLELVLPHYRMEDVINLMNDLNAPALDRLSLHLPMGRRVIDLSQALRLQTVFNDYTPRLQTLDLNAVSLPWTNPIFHSLTHLQISRQHPTNTPTAAVFTSVLAACPNLQTLQLSEAGVIVPFDDEPIPIVELPALRVLYLSNWPSQVYNILSCIRPAPVAVIHLECEIDSREQPLTTVIPRTFSLTNINNMFITLEESDVEVLCITEDKNIFTLFFNTKMGITISTWPCIIGLTHIWPMDSLRFLELKNCAQDVLSVDDWVRILCRLPQLENFTLDEIAFTLYVPVLLALQRLIINGFDAIKKIICRKLVKLVLSAVLEPLDTDLTEECINIRAGYGAPLIIEPRLLPT